MTIILSKINLLMNKNSLPIQSPKLRTLQAKIAAKAKHPRISNVTSVQTLRIVHHSLTMALFLHLM
jgi:hypothetical protein